MLAYNGDSWKDGYGLYDIGGRLYGLYGGKVAFDTGITLSANQWFYAAIVNDNPNTKMFFNNGGTTQTVDFGDSYPLPLSPQLNIGVAGGYDAWGGGPFFQDYLHGSADNVRVIAFGGSYVFNPSTDLLINATVPEPSTLAMLTLSLFGLAAYAWRKRK